MQRRGCCCRGYMPERLAGPPSSTRNISRATSAELNGPTSSWSRGMHVQGAQIHDITARGPRRRQARGAGRPLSSRRRRKMYPDIDYLHIGERAMPPTGSLRTSTRARARPSAQLRFETKNGCRQDFSDPVLRPHSLKAT